MRIRSILILLFLWAACDDNPTEVIRHKPVIHSISLERTIVYTGDTIEISANVSDEDEKDELRFKWSTDGGSFISESNNPTQWQAPNEAGTYSITLEVTDGYFDTSKSTQVQVKAR